MVSVAYYRTEAERCRELAARSKDPELTRQWLKLARDYEMLADTLEAGRLPAPPVTHTPMQQQPVQQQQAKSEPEDK